MRRRLLDSLARLNQRQYEAFGDPEIPTRIAQYEMAFRMQTSVPELVDISKEPPEVLELYGPDVKKPGSFAFNCLLARRMAERGVRFIQLYHRGWDQHGNLPRRIREQCQDCDQPSAALVKDLKRRGLLEETLVIWGGEFGRTVYCQGKIEPDNYGRDHHGRCYTMWLAGGGVKAGLVYGETDDYGYNIVENPVHIHDLNATILHCLGIHHEQLTYRFQGRDFRLTDVHGEVVKGILT
jgi:arylsulfatase A-like enzyme